MEKRLLLAAGLSLAVLILWELAVPKPKPAPRPPVPPAATAAPVSAPPAEAAPGAPAASAAPVAASEEVRTVLENDVLRLTLSNRGAVLVSAILKKYQDEQKQPLELVRETALASSRPLTLAFSGRAEETGGAAAALFAVEKRSDRAARWTFSDGRLRITKEIRLADGYLFDVAVSVVGPPYELSLGAGLRNPTAQELANRYVMPAAGVATAAGGGIERVRAEKLEKQEKGISWSVPAHGFAGIEDNYFLAVFLPDRPTPVRLVAVATKEAAAEQTAGDGGGSARRDRRSRRTRLFRAQGRRDPRGAAPRARANGGFRLVRAAGAPAPVAPQTDLPLGRQLGCGDPPRDARDPRSSSFR